MISRFSLCALLLRAALAWLPGTGTQVCPTAGPAMGMGRGRVLGTHSVAGVWGVSSTMDPPCLWHWPCPSPAHGPQGGL